MGKLYRLYDDMTDVGIDFDTFDFNQLPPRLDDIHPISEDEVGKPQPLHHLPHHREIEGGDGWSVTLE